MRETVYLGRGWQAVNLEVVGVPLSCWEGVVLEGLDMNRLLREVLASLCEVLEGQGRATVLKKKAL